MPSIIVPPLGESIVEATVSRWLKQEGDPVAAGETLVELETDKITVEVPALAAGILARRARQEGDVVKVGDTLGDVDEAGAHGRAPVPEAPPRDSRPAAPVGSSSRPAASPGRAVDPTAQSAAVASGESAHKTAPAARRLAEDHGIDLAAVQGTGRGGVVSKADVVDFAARRSAPPAEQGTAAAAGPRADTRAEPSNGTDTRETRERMTTRRKRIAENLLQSQHATAHLTTFNEVDMSAVVALRERLKERVEKTYGVKLSFMPFFVKAACVALKNYPAVNAQIDGDTIIYKHYVNMGIAVASDAGLVVPNVKDADRKGMVEVSRDIAAVASRARDGKLTMDDLTGGTFTITNGGVFGSLVSTPIINYPQVAILGLHKTQDRPVAVHGKVEIRPMMYIALSYDHRIIDGQQAVLFLVRIKELMEEPGGMLID